MTCGPRRARGRVPAHDDALRGPPRPAAGWAQLLANRLQLILGERTPEIFRRSLGATLEIVARRHLQHLPSGMYLDPANGESPAEDAPVPLPYCSAPRLARTLVRSSGASASLFARTAIEKVELDVNEVIREVLRLSRATRRANTWRSTSSSTHGCRPSLLLAHSCAFSGVVRWAGDPQVSSTGTTTSIFTAPSATSLRATVPAKTVLSWPIATPSTRRSLPNTSSVVGRDP